MAWWLQGMRTVGPHVASRFCEIVKLRNKLARNLGYEDFYDYKVLLPCGSLQGWLLRAAPATASVF